MTTHDAHLEWDELNDLVDGRLAAPDRGRAERHLVTCLDCSARRAELVELLASVSAVPESLTPPPGLWEEIRASLASPAGRSSTRARGGDGDRVVAHIAPGETVTRAPSRRWLAAAAIALVVGSSAITTVWLRATGREGGHSGAMVARESTESPPTAALPAAALPAALARAEAAYISDAESLRTLFERERSSLSPATIAVVERSLATIDAAIAEARAALVADPSNTELARFLDSSYRQKVELLRRVTTLEVRT